MTRSVETAPLSPAQPYELLHRGFRWQVPEQMNLAELCCGRWARETPEAVAIRHELSSGQVHAYSYAELQEEADRLARALARLGVARGDRVAVLLPQRFETAVAHIAVYQLGAVVVPLSALFGPEALTHRLRDSGACVALVDELAIAALREARAACPALTSLLLLGDAPRDPGEADWAAAVASEEATFTAARTRADDPALLIYTSGTTGPAKGALIPHRALIGNLSGFVCSQNFFPQADAVFWSPADWAWTGGLMDALLPTLYFGREIVAAQGRFDPERALALMARHRVTHAFLFPTALKAMMKTVPEPRGRHRLHLRGLMSAGEAVGDTLFNWVRDQLGVSLNEMFGQTEINYVVGNCASYVGVDGRRHPGWPAKPGSMGRPYPGHRVAVLDDQGRPCPVGTPGDVAVHRRDAHGDLDPVFFLGYWGNEVATRAKFTGDPHNAWCRTGDLAVMDEEGYLWHQGRGDDVFKSAGYRIGPGEVENCLLQHPAVANAAVVPKPDRERGALVKAFVVLAPGQAASPDLAVALQDHVRGRLAPYEYPKEIEFVEALPMTASGKVQRRELRLLEETRAGQQQPTQAG